MTLTIGDAKAGVEPEGTAGGGPLSGGLVDAKGNPGIAGSLEKNAARNTAAVKNNTTYTVGNAGGKLTFVEGEGQNDFSCSAALTSKKNILAESAQAMPGSPGHVPAAGLIPRRIVRQTHMHRGGLWPAPVLLLRKSGGLMAEAFQRILADKNLHPAYYDGLRCLAKKCGLSCCKGWDITFHKKDGLSRNGRPAPWN